MPNQPDRPNILLIMSDEHAPQTLGCYGADFAITPNIDRLAAEGVLFENAYCNYALCVPSRNSFLSGRLPHRVRAYDNGSPLESAAPTWAHMLRREGYRCIMDGKMHMIGPDQLHGFHEHWGEGAHGISGFRWGEEAPDRTGYTNWSEVAISPEKSFSCLDMERRDLAVSFLRDRERAEPFCLCVGFGYPHYPHRVTDRAFNLYNDVAIPAPKSREHLHPRNVHWSDGVWGFDRFTGEETRRARQAYMAMVTMMDEWVGDLLAALEETGALEETLIIYTSDHGEMWGEHGLWGKNLFYEESSRVPLIVRGPRFGVARGERIETPVSLVDLYPTLRDGAGAADWDVPLDGRSLWPACRQEERLDDRAVFCEYYASDTRGPERMIRWKNWKLNYYHNQPGVELYDLAADGAERHNLGDDPEYASIRDELMERLLADWDPEAVEADIRADQHRRSLICDALRAARRCAAGRPGRRQHPPG